MELNENKGKGKRVRCNPTRRWTVAEEKSVIAFLMENLPIEKPSAKVYYKRFCEENNIEMEWKLVRAKVRNLRSSYNKAKAWEGSTGAGSMNGDTIKGTLLKMCAFFYELDDIFGSRICESSVIVDTMAEENEEDEPIEMELPLAIQAQESCHISPSTSSMTPATLSESPVCTSILTQSLQSPVFTSNITSTSSQGPVCTSIVTPPTASQSPVCMSSPTPSKGIYSRTGASEIIKVQAEAMELKKQKLEADSVARDKELAIRENELILKQKEFALKERQAQNEEKFRESQLQSQEKLKILELEMKERLAMEKLKLKYK